MEFIETIKGPQTELTETIHLHRSFLSQTIHRLLPLCWRVIPAGGFSYTLLKIYVSADVAGLWRSMPSGTLTGEIIELCRVHEIDGKSIYQYPSF